MYYYYFIGEKQTKCQILVQSTVMMDRRILSNIWNVFIFFSANNIGLDYKSNDDNKKRDVIEQRKAAFLATPICC